MERGQVMSNGFPTEICIYCEECKSYQIATLSGEHGIYFVYECSNCGFHMLIPKGEAHRFTDFTLCGK